ncbi:hypothetical protein [Methylobacterium sp. J-030]|uniref:hypothetical protein n=1 Tax=Methylobacterium sp. J-030 TaxID=2836627 RepID=UPI003918C681
MGLRWLPGLRSRWVCRDGWVGPLARMAGVLPIVSMAALGRGVDVRVLAQVGGRVTLAVTASRAVLLAIAVLLIRALAIG